MNNKELMNGVAKMIEGKKIDPVDLPPDYVKILAKDGLILYVYLKKVIAPTTVMNFINHSQKATNNVRQIIDALGNDKKLSAVIHFDNLHPDYVGIVGTYQPIPFLEFTLNYLN